MIHKNSQKYAVTVTIREGSGDEALHIVSIESGVYQIKTGTLETFQRTYNDKGIVPGFREIGETYIKGKLSFDPNLIAGSPIIRGNPTEDEIGFEYIQ